MGMERVRRVVDASRQIRRAICSCRWRAVEMESASCRVVAWGFVDGVFSFSVFS